ncbi:MAG: transporter [Prevotellaceae bacterium]|nr:transporter [Prevotellaceae bacterium]
MLRILKDWTLPVAMLLGMIGFPLFSRLSFLMPYLIFAMLLLTFCKVQPRDLKPQPMHGWLLLFQLGVAPIAYLLLNPLSPLTAQAVTVCIVCPTATSAAVVTGKLGGDMASVSSFTMLSNVGAAIAVPILFPFIEPHPENSFLSASLLILSKVFLLLICPLLLAFWIRRTWPRIHQKLTAIPDLAFYLWTGALTIVTAQIIHSFLLEPIAIYDLLIIGLTILIICSLQFFIGKRIGDIYKGRITGGQALGQKNTILAIWMAHAYLNPLAAVGPGFYVLWQNSINSWQIWRTRKRTTQSISKISS